MKKSRLTQYLHILPLIGFLALAAIFSASSVHEVLEPPLLLPLLNTALLAVLPFIIAFLAAWTYVRQGSPVFALFGCGMVALGLGGLFAGWGLFRYGQNFTVTVHNVGCLLGGFCHLGAAGTLIFRRPAAPERPTPRAAVLALVIAYSVIALALVTVSILTAKGSFPTFFVQGQGPTTLRQVVLVVAVGAYALSGIVMVDLHSLTRETLFRLYANALSLVAIGLGIVLSEKSVGGLLSWTGRASQYAGSLYFLAAVVVGQRTTGRIGVTLPVYLNELLSSHIDREVRTRTRELAELNEKLRLEASERMEAESELRRSEERLRLAAAAAGFGVYEYTIETGSAYYSPELLALFGLPTGALPPPGADLLATTLHPDDRTAFLSQMNAANDPQRPGVLDLEFRIRRPDGETRWLRLLGRTTCLDSGGDARPCYVSGIIQDVTERRSADEKIREREETYRSVIENSLQGFAIMQDGRIVLCNDELCRMDGYTKEETYGMTPAQVLATVHAEEREVVIEAMRAHAIGGDPPPAAVIRLLRKDGGFRWVEVLTARSKYRERPAIQLSYLDLTEKRRAEAAYRSLIDHAINGIAILQDGRIKFANQGLADIYGYTIAELLCLTPEQIEEMVHEADRKRIGSHLLQRLAGRIAAPIQVYRVVRKDGSVRWVEAQSARIDHEGLPAIQVSYKDATAEKAAEEQLKDAHQKMRNLADHLLRVREEERQHVSQEVHDELGQPLAALKMDLHWLAKRLGGDVPALREKIRGSIELGEQAIRSVQRIASDLRPRMLDDLGLAPALEWLGADFARRTKIACKVTADVPPGVVGGSAATVLYRFAQEALANVRVHSHADHAAVRLSLSQGSLVLQIEDDGVGITTDQAASPESFGLIGLRERVEGLDGTLSIRGDPGFGTILLARVPLHREGGIA